MSPQIDIRVGLPLPKGGLLDYARKHKLPALVSANAFFRHKADGPGSFKLPSPGQFDGCNVALDSAGYVAMARYRSYPWTLEDYIELAAAAPWAWWASADYCVEPQVASSEFDVQMRLAGTVRNYLRLCVLAEERGITQPLPVIQGWKASHYAWCADQMGLTSGSNAVQLIGVGSMCRRHLNGTSGIAAIVEVLDRVLPPGCQLHLFGVKSDGLKALAGHPRLRSIDSCAWDFGLRMSVPVGRTMDLRQTAMHAWYLRQRAALHSQPSRLSATQVDALLAAPLVDVTHGWADLVMDGALEYDDAARRDQLDPDFWDDLLKASAVCDA